MSDEKPSELAALIPEIYFDLIGRVVPGILVLLTLMAAFGLFNKEGLFALDRLLHLKSWGPATTLLIILFAAGYVYSMLISPIARRISGRYRIWRNIAKQSLLDLRALDTQLHSQATTLYEGVIAELEPNRIDQLEQAMLVEITGEDEQAAKIMPKLRAECDLCSILATSAGLGLLTIVIAPLFGVHVAKSPLAVLALVAVLVFGVWAARFRTQRMVLREFSYYRKLHSTNRELARSQAA